MFSPQRATVVFAMGLVALFILSAVPASALTPPPGPFPGLNPLCDYPANSKVYISWNGWVNQHGLAVSVASPVVKTLGNTSGVNLYEFRMASEGPFHLNPSTTWNEAAYPDYILCEWDECWLNATGSIIRVHHSDYTSDHQQINGAYSIPINNASQWQQPGMILQNAEDGWFDFYTQSIYAWNQAHTHGMDVTGETDWRENHNVTWTENLYLNGSDTLMPLGWVGSNNAYDPGEHNFMAAPPAVYIPVLFQETYLLRFDWLDYDYTQYQSSTPLPTYPSVVGGYGLPVVGGTSTGGSGGVYVDRQQLDSFLANDSTVGKLNLTQRSQLYAWNLMEGQRISALSDSLVAITHQGGLGTDASRCKINGETLIWLAENYRQAALTLARTNGTASDIINATTGAWMNYEAANYYDAAAVIFNTGVVGDLALGAAWEAQAYDLTQVQYADAQPDYSSIYEANGLTPTNETAGIFDWIMANPGLTVAVAGLALTVLAAIVRNPWFIILSILVALAGVLLYATGY